MNEPKNQTFAYINDWRVYFLILPFGSIVLLFIYKLFAKKNYL